MVRCTHAHTHIYTYIYIYIYIYTTPCAYIGASHSFLLSIVITYHLFLLYVVVDYFLMGLFAFGSCCLTIILYIFIISYSTGLFLILCLLQLCVATFACRLRNSLYKRLFDLRPVVSCKCCRVLVVSAFCVYKFFAYKVSEMLFVVVLCIFLRAVCTHIVS